MTGHAVRLADLSVHLGAFRLQDMTLDIAPGEYLVILGPTGAGKTVLLETLAGLHAPRAGQVWIDDQDVTRTPPDRRGVGFVYQDYVLFPHMDVAANIAFGLRTRRQPKATIAERVTELAELLHITSLLERRPRTLSGGEQQRVALARALATQPRLLLMDEPLSALDPETREQLQRELARLHHAVGTTTIHVTHDFEEAVALGQRIAVIHEGQIAQIGPPDEIFRRPANTDIARFVGVRNIFEGTLRPSGEGYALLDVDSCQIAVITDRRGPVHASLRPEDILLAGAPLHSSARNCFCGKVVDILDRGTLVYVTVDVPPAFTCVVTRRSREELALEPGREIYIAFKASAVHVI